MNIATQSSCLRETGPAGRVILDSPAHDGERCPVVGDRFCSRIGQVRHPSAVVTAVLAATLLAPSLLAALAGHQRLTWALLAVGGTLAIYLARVRRGKGIVLFGSGHRLRHLRTELQGSRLPYQVLAVIDDGCPRAARELEAVVDEFKPQRVVVAMAERRGRLPLKTLVQLRAQGVSVTDDLEFSERLTGKIPIEALTPSSLIFANEFHKSWWTLAVSRAVNAIGAAVSLLLLSPVFLLVALAIKLDSPGPVFFVHRRLGRHGKPFNLVKFRTMNPRRGESSEWEDDNRERITRVGKVLRKFRLDELPQFLNILRGDMNLVGPRPHPTTNHRLFLDNIPFYPLRCAIRPGITGWAQIKYGYANNLEEETEKMRFDLYYVKHMSLLLDLRIVVDTVATVVLGRNGRVAAEEPSRLDVALAPGA